MQIEVITRDDLEMFRKQLLQDLQKFISKQGAKQEKPWLRSREVREMLGISNGTLVNLRVRGRLHASKIEGVYYYKRSEILELLHGGE